MGDGAGPVRVAVDTSGLDFFDSAGIRCLVSACRKVRRADGVFVVVDAGPVMRRRVERMGLAGLLPVMPSLLA